MKILIYLRPDRLEFFTSVANNTFRNPEIRTFSDFKNVGEFWAGNFIYNDKYDFENKDFEKEVEDILPRCRTLRKIGKENAYKLAHRYWNGIDELFTKEKFDYVLMNPIDCYALDVIDRVARLHGALPIAFIGAPYAEGKTRITVRGEFNPLGIDVQQHEIDAILEKMLQVNYLTYSEKKNVQKNHKSIYQYYARRFLIENFYNPYLKIRDHDPWNYRYNIYDVKGSKFKDRYDGNFENRFHHLDDISFDPKTTVYYPMHLVPEATTDYWCQDIKASAYSNYVLDMIRNADPGITFLIKEHPAMYGRRMLSFYDQLNSMENVILIHPMDRSNVLLEQVENVVVDNGTVGIEALVRNKRVLVISDNYYYRFHKNAFRITRITRESLDISLNEPNNEYFLRSLLGGAFKSDLINTRKGVGRSDPEQIAAGIRQYLDYNGKSR